MSGFLGFGKKTDKELARENERALRKVGRDLDREKLKLEQEEKKLVLEIKKAANEGNKEVCAILAKQLVQMRKAKTRAYAAKGKIQTVGTTAKVMQANTKMAEVMGETTKAMGQMNKVLNPAKINKTMQDFAKETAKMEMTDEMINDTLDDLLTESGDEEESDNIVTQILDEIGIEISGKVAEAPSAGTSRLGEASKGRTRVADLPTDDDLEAQLARLRTT
ncbi:unnamed protein product [Orchesella dallaii]|uniref:Charged multivesicular body protein 2b n=1 Tax=Orchesella dallaii TaxID=48710 RepID=A0ABP1QN75_9HEXA